MSGPARLSPENPRLVWESEPSWSDYESLCVEADNFLVILPYDPRLHGHHIRITAEVIPSAIQPHTGGESGK